MLYVGMLWCFKLECCGVVVLHGGVLWRVVVFNVDYVECWGVLCWSVVELWCFMV